MTVICSYCENPARLATGAEVYAHLPELAEKKVWTCDPCDAWVGCHGNTDKPLGRLANLELRQAKMLAHSFFDPLWRAKMERGKVSKNRARNAAYNWLAQKLEIPFAATHIGMFDVQMCKKVVEICKPHALRIMAQAHQ